PPGGLDPFFSPARYSSGIHWRGSADLPTAAQKGGGSDCGKNPAPGRFLAELSAHRLAQSHCLVRSQDRKTAGAYAAFCSRAGFAEPCDHHYGRPGRRENHASEFHLEDSGGQETALPLVRSDWKSG